MEDCRFIVSLSIAVRSAVLGISYAPFLQCSWFLWESEASVNKYPLEVNIAPENIPSQKESSLPTGGYVTKPGAMLVSGRICSNGLKPPTSRCSFFRGYVKLRDCKSGRWPYLRRTDRSWNPLLLPHEQVLAYMTLSAWFHKPPKHWSFETCWGTNRKISPCFWVSKVQWTRSSISLKSELPLTITSS